MSDEKVELNWDEPGEKKGISEVIKKVVASGISSAFMTEEGLRSYLSDVKLPKDVLAQILKGAKKSRDEVIGKAGSELSKLIRKIDLVAEFRKLLEDHKISIKAEIDFQPKDKNLPEKSTESPED